MDQISEQEAVGLDLPVLRSERLVLRLAGPADERTLFGHLDDWDVARMLARVPWPVPQASLHTFLQNTAGRASRGEAFEMAVLPQGFEPCGVVGLEYQEDEIHLGYWLGRVYWGRGMMTEAVSMVLRHVFDRQPGIRVASGVFSDNPASLRVQEKLGFRVVGSHMRWCEARREDVLHIDTVLTRELFREEAR